MVGKALHLVEGRLHGLVGHHRFGRIAYHVRQADVDGPVALRVFKAEHHVARGASHHIHRRTLALADATHQFYVFVLEHQSHALLAFVAYYFAGRQRVVAHRQAVHVDGAARLFYQFRQAVEVAARAVVVYRDNRVAVRLDHGSDGVHHALLHFGVRALHRIEFYAVAILARGHARHCAAAHSDAVVVAAEHHHLVARLGLVLQGVAALGKADAARQHYHLVVGIFTVVLLVLERQHRAADYGLPELVAKVAGTVRRLYKNLSRSLIEPFAHAHSLLPWAVVGQSRIRRHIHGRACHRQRTGAAGQSVAYFAASAGRRAVEWLHGCREVVRLGLERQHGLDVFRLELTGLVAALGRKLHCHRAFDERHIVLVGRHQIVGVGLRRALDQFEERAFLLLAVNHKHAAENLVAAVLRVDLRKAEHFAVGQLAAQAAAQVVEIFYFDFAQSQALLAVVCLKVVDVDDGFGLAVGVECLLVEPLVEHLEHRVIFGLVAAHAKELFDATDAADAHVLGYFDGIGAPRRDHLLARPHKEAVHRVGACQFRPTEEPFQFRYVVGQWFLRHLDGYDSGIIAPEKQDHIIAICGF